MRILIVDDEEDIGLMVTKFLNQEGMDADYAASITAAKRKIRDESYQLFFLDLNLPDGTGFDLMPDIYDNNRDPRIIVISAYDDLHETKRAEDLGVDIFIKKPFSKNDVLRAVRDLT